MRINVYSQELTNEMEMARLVRQAPSETGLD